MVVMRGRADDLLEIGRRGACSLAPALCQPVSHTGGTPPIVPPVNGGGGGGGGTASTGIPWPTIGIATGVVALVGAAAWYFTKKKRGR